MIFKSVDNNGVNGLSLSMFGALDGAQSTLRSDQNEFAKIEEYLKQGVPRMEAFEKVQDNLSESAKTLAKSTAQSGGSFLDASKSLTTMSRATVIAELKMKALNMAINVGAMLAVTLAIKGVVYAFNEWSVSLEEQKATLAEVSTKYDELNKEIKELEELSSKKLTSPYDTGLTDNEKKRLEYLRAIKANLEVELNAEKEKTVLNDWFGEGNLNPFASTKSKTVKKLSDFDWVGTDAFLSQTSNLGFDAIQQGDALSKRFTSLNSNFTQLVELKTEADKLLQDDTLTSSSKNKIQIQADMLDVLIERYKAAMDEILSTGMVADSITDVLSDTDDLDKSKKSVESLEEAFKSLKDTMTSITSNHDLFKSASEEFSKTGIFSIGTIQKLSEAYPQLNTLLAEYITGVKNSSDVYKGLQSAYDNDVAAYKRTILSKVETSEAFYKSTGMMDQATVDVFKNNYGVDLQNCKTYAQAKLQIESQLLKDVAYGWSTYYDAQTKMWTDEYMKLGLSASYSESSRRMLAQLDQMHKAMKAIDDISFKGISTEFENLSSKVDETNKALQDLIAKEESRLKSYGKAALASIDKRIEAKRKEIEVINAQYEAEDDLLQLQKARDAYENAKNQKNTRVYYQDRGWVWEADQQKVNEAKEALEEIEREQAKKESIKAIEEEIDSLEELKSKWQDAVDRIGQDIDEHNMDLDNMVKFEQGIYQTSIASLEAYVSEVEKLAARAAAAKQKAISAGSSASSSSKEEVVFSTKTSVPIKGGRATGDNKILHSGLYLTDEKRQNELIIRTGAGNVKYLEYGDKVIPAKQSNWIMDYLINTPINNMKLPSFSSPMSNFTNFTSGGGSSSAPIYQIHIDRIESQADSFDKLLVDIQRRARVVSPNF